MVVVVRALNSPIVSTDRAAVRLRLVNSVEVTARVRKAATGVILCGAQRAAFVGHGTRQVPAALVAHGTDVAPNRQAAGSG